MSSAPSMCLNVFRGCYTEILSWMTIVRTVFPLRHLDTSYSSSGAKGIPSLPARRPQACSTVCARTEYS